VVTTPRPVGRRRGVVFAVLMSLTGIYILYWAYKTFGEIRAFRGSGVSALVGALLTLVGVGCFLLPAYVGRMEREEGLRPRISGWSGLWILVPAVGSQIWIGRVQSELNRFWQEVPAERASA
jgi:hypothetical protein